jgi:hypothetical protein
MKQWTTLLLLILSATAHAQPHSDIYRGGIPAMFKVVNSTLKYPPDERSEFIEGIVIFKFKTRGGNIDSLEVINSIAPEIDAEAKRVLLQTNGNWLTDSTDPMIFPLTFILDYPGRRDDETLMDYRDKLMKKGRTKEALTYAEQIKMRDPYEEENLAKLIALHNELNRPEDAKRVETFREQLGTLKIIR